MNRLSMKERENWLDQQMREQQDRLDAEVERLLTSAARWQWRSWGLGILTGFALGWGCALLAVSKGILELR